VLRRIKLTGPRTPGAGWPSASPTNELGQLTDTRRDTLRTLLTNYSNDPTDGMLRDLLDASAARKKRHE